jgi:hypothetical protein
MRARSFKIFFSVLVALGCGSTLEWNSAVAGPLGPELPCADILVINEFHHSHRNLGNLLDLKWLKDKPRNPSRLRVLFEKMVQTRNLVGSHPHSLSQDDVRNLRRGDIVYRRRPKDPLKQVETLSVIKSSPTQVLFKIEGHAPLLPVRVSGPAIDRVHRNLFFDPNDITRAEFTPLSPGLIQKILEPIFQVSLSFELGERIRYRDNHGELRMGVYVRPMGSTDYLIYTVTREQLYVPKGRVYKAIPGSLTTEPFPWSISNDAAFAILRAKGFTRFDSPSGSPNRGMAYEVLNAAAYLMSLPEVLSMTTPDRVRVLLLFQHILMPWSISAYNPTYETRIKNFSDLFCKEPGVCRHSTPFIQILLWEQGLEARAFIASHPEPSPNGEHLAHTWLESNALDPLGQIWVIDPSSVLLAPSSELENHPYFKNSIFVRNTNRREVRPENISTTLPSR